MTEERQPASSSQAESPSPSVPPRSTHLDSVRSALQGMGYLDHKVERFLLQDALRPRQMVRAVVGLSAKVGLLAGALAALVATLVLATWNDLWRLGPFDVVPLFVHLLPIFALALGLAFLLLAGILALVLQLSHTRRIEAVSLGVALAVGALALVLVLRLGRPLLDGVGTPALLLSALAGAAAVAGLVWVVHGGLLALSIRLTDQAPRGRISGRLWPGLTVLVAVALLLVPALLAVRRAPTPPASLALQPGVRVALLGVDGVRADELRFLLSEGALPNLAARLETGGVLARYDRPRVTPASLWTTIATGIEEPDHGMVALDGYRPRGMRETLTRSGWLRHVWSSVGVSSGLVVYRPVLSHQRRAPAVWELAARGAVPVLAVNWWGTFPAGALPGLVVAHGGYQLLAEGSEHAVAPEDERSAIEALRARASGSTIEQRLTPALPAARADALLEASVRPDVFYASAFREALAMQPRVAALYLPALDILTDQHTVGSVPLAALVRWQLATLDELLDPSATGAFDGVDSVVVVFDPGRRTDDDTDTDAGGGMVLVWRRDGCLAPEDAPPMIAPAAVASALLRALGMPQSRELPEPPDFCRWPTASVVVDTFGNRERRSRAAQGEAYLDNLRSLGYL